MAAQYSDVVPGTIYLVDNSQDEIVLNPKPSLDPEDPLNWKPWRKQRAIIMLYVYILGIGIATTVQYSVLEQISEETGITVAQLDTGTGLMFLFLGWGCLIWVPISLVFGRRGVYILSSLLAMGPMIWTAYSHSAGEWYAHRILLGIFAAPCEALPEVTIPDIFFAHERGFYIGVYALFAFGSNALSPLIAGFITKSMGWRAAIWFGVITLGVSVIIIFFGFEETMYFRSTVEGVYTEDTADKTLTTGAAAPAELEKKVPSLSARETDVAIGTTTQAAYEAASPSYLSKLRIFRSLPGRPSVKHMFVMMYRPLIIFFYFPSIDWAGFLYGINLSWYTVLNGTMSSVLSAAPYNFAPSMVGLSYVSPLIGSVLGAVWGGWVGDKIALRLARRNGGVREAEHRLWTLTLSAVVGAAGFILWGVGAAHSVNWSGPVIGAGMVEFSIVVGAATSLAYGVDSFKELSGEAIILIIVIRNTIGFGFSYGITPWLNADGYTKTFVAVAMLSLATSMSFLFMIFFGKTLRKNSAQKYWQFVDSLILRGSH